MARKKETVAKKSVQRVKVTFIEEAAVHLIQDTNDAMKMKRLNVSPLQDRNEANTNVDSWSDNKYDQEMNNNISSVRLYMPSFLFTEEDELSRY